MSTRRIEPQIQISGRVKTESSVVAGKLVRRQSEIEQHTVDMFDLMFFQNRRCIGVARMFQDDALGIFGVRTKFRAGMGEHHRVTIQPDQYAIGANLPPNFFAVTCGPNGSIEHTKTRRQLRFAQNLPQQHRPVNRDVRPLRISIGRCHDNAENNCIPSQVNFIDRGVLEEKRSRAKIKTHRSTLGRATPI